MDGSELQCQCEEEEIFVELEESLNVTSEHPRICYPACIKSLASEKAFFLISEFTTDVLCFCMYLYGLSFLYV